MAEELSPESKLYVKEEIEKIKKEFKNDLKEAQSKATKTFATVALIIGLLASVGVLSLARNYIDAAMESEIGKDTIEQIKEDVKTLSGLKTELAENQLPEENGYAWIGDVKIIWGTVMSKEEGYPEAEKLSFNNGGFDAKCLAVIPDMPGYIYGKNEKAFWFDRIDLGKTIDGKIKTAPCSYVAIGN